MSCIVVRGARVQIVRTATFSLENAEAFPELQLSFSSR
jgi:hypothetical protein